MTKDIFIDTFEENGTTWYLAKDVLRSLGYSVSNNASKTPMVLTPSYPNQNIRGLLPRLVDNGDIWWTRETLIKLNNYLKGLRNCKGKGEKLHKLADTLLLIKKKRRGKCRY
jgi:hypothetical protein